VSVCALTCPLSSMFQVSSRSNVNSLLLLCCTIRWLAGALLLFFYFFFLSRWRPITSLCYVGGSPWDICFAFNVGYSTLHDKKYEVIRAINRVLHRNIQFPTTEEGLQQLAQGFARVASGKGSTIPNVVAAVDSVVIPRKTPIASKEKNVAGQYCRKGYFATTMLAFVDASSRFLSVSVRCASSSHDSTLFGCSSLGKKILSGGLGDKWVVVGDDAFTSCGNVITPFSKHTLNARQRNFNYFCSLLRQVVECAFGRWKMKWGVLWRPLLVDADNISAVLMCTCHLHNFCIDQNCADVEKVPFLEDVWWLRTASPNKTAAGKASPPPIAVMDNFWADAATVSAAIGPVSRVWHSARERAVDCVERSGLVAPDIGGTWTKRAMALERLDAVGHLSRWVVE
jgi:hypothetical protein